MRTDYETVPFLISFGVVALFVYPVWKVSKRIQSSTSRLCIRAAFLAVTIGPAWFGEGHGNLWFPAWWAVGIGIKQWRGNLFLLGFVPMAAEFIALWIFLVFRNKTKKANDQ